MGTVGDSLACRQKQLDGRTAIDYIHRDEAVCLTAAANACGA